MDLSAWITRDDVGKRKVCLRGGRHSPPSPAPDHLGARVRQRLVVTRHDRRFDRKHMIKNLTIPRYKTIIPDSEISDGTTPVFADSEARPERFLQKRKFFSDRADKNRYFPVLMFGREDSDASRRFVTWGIEIYNQIMRLSILRVKNYRATQKTGRSRRVTWGSRRAAFAALTRVLTPGGRGCGSPWSLSDMTADSIENI